MTLYGWFTLLGGLGLFLYGMSAMSSGLQSAAGDSMRKFLEKATSNRFLGVLIGMLVTFVIQSSSATDMIVIGFINAGMMNLIQAVGVMMGANIGTTITAQITAFNLSEAAPIFLFLGVAVFMFVKNNRVKSIGMIIMGFGMLFFGVTTMKGAIAPLAESPFFLNFLVTLENPVIAIVFSAIFTAIIQSSSSATVIYQTFAIQGLIPFEMAAYLCLGAAIGTTSSNFLAALAGNRNGLRAAVINLTMNIIRAIVLGALITAFPQILVAIKNLSPDDIGRQVANAHTVFAVVAMVIQFPFAALLVKLAQKVVPVKEEETRALEERKLHYMNDTTENLPSSVALKQAHLEISRMGRLSCKNLQDAVNCFFNLDSKLAFEVEEREDTINHLNHEITEKLVLLQSLDMNDKERHMVSQLTLVVSDIERISDHAENIVEYYQQVKAKQASISPEALEELKGLAESSIQSIEMCLDIFETGDFDRIPKAEALEQYVDDLQNQVVANHVARLMTSQCDPRGGVVFTDMSSDLERCSDHAINIATALSEYHTQD